MNAKLTRDRTVMANFLCQLDWAKGYSHIWLNIVSRYVYRVFLEEIRIWIGEQSKAHCPPQCRWALSNLLRAWIEQKGRGRLNSLFLPDCMSWDISLFLPLDWDLYHQHCWFSTLRTRIGIYSTHFPGTLACRQQIVRLFSASTISWTNSL